jgi:hypothetical protein
MMWKAVVAYFKALLNHFPGGINKESYENLSGKLY